MRGLAVIRATEADRAEIEAFLTPRAPFAMFPLSNLADHGMAGGDARAMRFWVARRAGEITDALGLTEAGMAMPCLPGRDFAAAAEAVRGETFTGIIGPRDQARGLETAAGLASGPRTLDHDEPHFLLDLDRMRVPDGPGTLRALGDMPEEIIRDWMADYQRGTLNTPADKVTERVADWHDRCVQSGRQVVLAEGDTPLAMTGFNACLPQIVQIGGVYTPRPLRGRGHARRAVALHLARARGQGVRQATLFAANDMAIRAYRSLGFRQVGEWTLLLFDGPQVAG
jgi:RimJ/RimL family protein N-acetyltransferase